MVKHLVGIVGNKNTGKTTTTVNLTNYLINLGYKVAIIKFSHHKFSLESESKDSVILRKTNATSFIFTNPYENIIFQTSDSRTDVPTLLQHLPEEVDIVFCESYPSKFPEISLIFVCSNSNDYFETKTRFNTQRPLFITGIISENGPNTLEGVPILSNSNPTHLDKCLKLILQKNQQI
ncbi:MAG: molybdopterin-guanine dinucleotide biosynthesis protein MobB [Candidatus Hodarchaeales archaeon]|jgi:molybdopterin-guanine dinucleotide biosynthesis protein MobB